MTTDSCGFRNVTLRLCSLPGSTRVVLEQIRAIAEQRGDKVFLVGGMVRDLLAGMPNLDIDITVAGDGSAFAQKLADLLGGSFLPHRGFGTARVVSDYGVVDVVGARREYYRQAAALPTVEPGSLHDDLFRRDFTINAMAICLSGNDYGTVVDFFGGQRDLSHRLLRVLHDLSFIDDPTRLFRMIRFQHRLGFMVEDNTDRLAREAINNGMVDQLTAERFTAELLTTLDEPDPGGAVLLMGQLGLLAGLDPEVSIRHTELIRMALDHCRKYEFQPSPDEKLIWSVSIWWLLDSEHRQYLQSRLKLPRTGQRLLRTADMLSDLMNTLDTDRLTDSAVYAAVKSWPTELLILSYALGSDRVRKRLMLFWDRLRQVEVLVTGYDLMEHGYRPGPLFSDTLTELKRAVLDGKVYNREQQLHWALTYIRSRLRTVELE